MTNSTHTYPLPFKDDHQICISDCSRKTQWHIKARNSLSCRLIQFRSEVMYVDSSNLPKIPQLSTIAIVGLESCHHCREILRMLTILSHRRVAVCLNCFIYKHSRLLGYVGKLIRRFTFTKIITLSLMMFI